MNKVMKITLAATAMFAISFTLGCSVNKSDGEKWCVIEVSGSGANMKNCFKIGPKATLYKNELLCLGTKDAKVVDPPSRSECVIYDD